MRWRDESDFLASLIDSGYWKSEERISVWAQELAARGGEGGSNLLSSRVRVHC